MQLNDRRIAVDRALDLIKQDRLSANKAAEAAAKPYGITGRTVKRWATDQGRSLGDAARSAGRDAAKHARGAREDEYRAQRLKMRCEAAHEALRTLRAMADTKPRDRRELAVTFGILLDKIRLEEGRGAARTEAATVEQAMKILEAEIERLDG